jgi:predicted DNA-binding ribbon-helix-helix protein
MVRTTISLEREEFEEIKRLAARQDRTVSWLLRQAFRLSRARLESGEPYGVAFDRVWEQIGRSLRRAGVRTTKDVNRLVREVRSERHKTQRVVSTR